MNIIKRTINKLLKKEDKSKVLLEQVIKEIINTSYYDEKTNTLVVHSPTNIVIKSEGSQMFITDGYKIDIAQQIHLNPRTPLKSRININKTNVNVRDTLIQMEEALINE